MKGKIVVLVAVFIVAAYVIMRKLKNVDELIVSKIAGAIAYAEGFYKQGSRPQRNHNPGDLTLDLTGKATGKDGIYVVYGNDSDGWEALKKQVRLMLNGGSGIYTASMTILEVAKRYTTTEQEAWAGNVASHLGVNVNTPLTEIKA